HAQRRGQAEQQGHRSPVQLHPGPALILACGLKKGGFGHPFSFPAAVQCGDPPADLLCGMASSSKEKKMRNLLVGALLCFGTLFGLPAAAETCESGTHYSELRTPQPVAVPGKIEVVEIFWYGCPACNMFEGSLKPWAAQLPEDVHFVRVPAQ